MSAAIWIPWTILAVQAAGAILALGGDKDDEPLANLGALVLWPILIPWMILGATLSARGYFHSWNGPLSQSLLQDYRAGIYWEQSFGPFASGHWCREVGTGIVVTRWVRVGVPGGRGFTFGWTQVNGS